MQIKQHHLSLDLPVTFLQEGKSVIAYTPALDLSTSGKDVKEAKKRFIEIVRMFIDDLIENDTLELVLIGLGWTQTSAKKDSSTRNWLAPQKFISQEDMLVTV